MAVKESIPGVIRSEVNLDLLACGHEDDIFDESPRRQTAGQACDLKAVAVQVDRVVVDASILEAQPIALAMNKLRGLGIRIGLSVDRPVVEIAVAGEL